MAIHVTPHKDGWQVKTGGNEKAYRVVDTQKEALEIANMEKMEEFVPLPASPQLSHNQKPQQNHKVEQNKMPLY